MKNPYINAVSLSYVLLECYKRLGLSDDELVVVLMIDHLLEQGNTFINGDMLSLKINKKPSEIDAIMNDLLKKNLISYETVNGKLTLSLNNLREKAYASFKDIMDREASKLTDKGREEVLNGLYSFYEGRLNRSLTPLELSTINEWLDAKYSVEEIKNALLDTLKTNKKSIGAIGNTLKNSRKEKDILREGSSAVSETWDKDIEETIALAKDLWAK